jgi:hypothetical protein
MDECPARRIGEIVVIVESGMRRRDYYFGPVEQHAV